MLQFSAWFFGMTWFVSGIAVSINMRKLHWLILLLAPFIIVEDLRTNDTNSTSTKWAVSFCIVLFAATSCTLARADDAAYANMQRAVGGILQQTAVSRGYSLSDPRTYSTLYGVGKATAAAAAGAGTGLLIGGTVPAWGTILAVAAVSGAVTYGVGVTLDAAVKWGFGTGNTPIAVTAPSASTSSNVLPAATGNSGCSNPTYSQINNLCVKLGERDPLCSPSPPYSCQTVPLCVGQTNPTLLGCGGANAANTNASDTLAALKAGGVLFGSSSGTNNSAGTTSNQTLDQAIASLTATQKQQAVNYDAMSLIINQMWSQAAAQPGYSGVPFSLSNQVSASDVQTWAQANPSAYPSVDAMVAPVGSASGFAPSSSTSTGTAVSPATNSTGPTETNPAAQQPQTNLGPDPNVGFTIPTAPTEESIFQPFLDMARPFTSLQINAPAGVCPKPTFDVFGAHIQMYQHCDIFETLRETIQIVMSAVFVVAAFLIVFSA